MEAGKKSIPNLIHNFIVSILKVTEERCCDVTFSFPHCASSATSSIPTVKAHKNALIAKSPVFEVQFEGGFSDASCEEFHILDTEPKYMRCLLQFIFTRWFTTKTIRIEHLFTFRFVPLLSLKQAFEILYLARNYIIHDLKEYCKHFIMNNEKKLAGVIDVFQFLEMNGKSCGEDICQFICVGRVQNFCKCSYQTATVKWNRFWYFIVQEEMKKITKRKTYFHWL